MIYNTTTQNIVAIKTVGLNVKILKDSTDLNNIRYLVQYVESFKNKTIVANCGNYDDAISIAHSC